MTFSKKTHIWKKKPSSNINVFKENFKTEIVSILTEICNIKRVEKPI